MPRTDENGKGIQAVLGYLADRVVSEKEIYGVLGVSRNTYVSRSEADTFPNAEECRLLAEHLKLNPVDLMIRFGLITKEHARAVAAPPVPTVSTSTSRLTKISDLPLNEAVPPL